MQTNTLNDSNSNLKSIKSLNTIEHLGPFGITFLRLKINF